MDAITADTLISEYGNHAYQKCSEMIIEFAYGNSFPDLTHVAAELELRGYR
jgi:hypothetical protein